MKTLRRGIVAMLAVAFAVPAHAQQATTLDAILDGLEWRSIGPANMMGRVTDVEGIPSPSSTFFFASAAGGVWKTTNNGTTFRPLFQNERIASLGDLAIAPSDTMQIWLGTGEEDSRNSISAGGGIYKSVDGGLTWTLMGLEKTEHIGRVVVHPTNPDIVWVAAMGATWRENPERGLYKTTDGGKSWRQVKAIDSRTGFIDLVIDPSNPDVLFASSWERIRGPYFLQSGGPGSALWKSTDAGETWTEVKGGGFPETMKGRIGIDIAKSNPDIVYALVEAEAPDTTGGCRAAKAGGCGLYRSADAGRTWTWMAPQNVRPFYYSQVRVDPADEDRVYWSSTPVSFSTDGGKTVRTASQGVHVDHHAMWIDPLNPNRMIVGNDGGIGISFDRGGNYWFPNTIPLGQFYAVSYDMAVPYNICGGLQDNGTWCGPSRRPSGSLTNSMWATVSGGDGFVTAQDPRDACIVYSESQGGAMGRRNICTGENLGIGRPSFRTQYEKWEDSIATAQPDPLAPASPEVTARVAQFRQYQVRDSLDDQFRYNWNTPFFLSPHNPDVFYAGANRVLRSTDKGETLIAISPDLSKKDSVKLHISRETTGGITLDATGAETYGTIVSLNESPVRRGFLAAGTDDGNVWITTNDGGTWTDITGRFRGLVPDTSYVSRIEFSHADASRFYITFDNHRRGDFTPYIFATQDGGSTFRSIASNLPTGAPDYVHVVREDPVNPNILYVGTDVGLYLSTNQGASWQKWGRGFPTTPVHDLQIHPRDRELIVGTHGRSIWVVDVAPLQQITPTLLAGETPVLFKPAAGLQFSAKPMGGESAGHSIFRGENRSYGAEITYYNPVATDSAVRIVIRNSSGDTVQTLNGSGDAGLQRVTWNFRSRGEAEEETTTPSERRDSLVTMRRADVVADSLIAAGSDEAMVRRVAALLKGETPEEVEDEEAPSPRPGAGGPPARRAPGEETWNERPGEGDVRGGGGGGRGRRSNPQSEMIQKFREAGIMGVPGAALGGGGFGGGGAGDVVEPGTFELEVVIGGRALSADLVVIRAPRD